MKFSKKDATIEKFNYDSKFDDFVNDNVVFEQRSGVMKTNAFLSRESSYVSSAHNLS